MIIYTHNERGYDDLMAMLRVINELRGRGPGYHPPCMGDTPWIKTRRANPRYL